MQQTSPPPLPDQPPGIPGTYGDIPIRLCTVPESAPPFDHDISDGNGPVQPAPVSLRGREATALREADADPPGSGRLVPGEPDAPGPWPGQFAQVLAETLAGSRPARQLTPWTTEQARRRIRQLGPMLASEHRPRVRRVMISAPAANVLEMTAVVGFGPRVRVLAVRLERARPRAHQAGGSRWCCTAIESA